MEKIVHPALCKVYNRINAKAFAQIIYKDETLSIHGVIGPRITGNCMGSAGQCFKEISEGTPAPGWTREMLDKFVSIWERWHLNDMNPACEHQRNLGWYNDASQKVTVYHYQLTDEAHKKKKEAEKAAIKALKNRETFIPTKEQTMYATLPDYAQSISTRLVSPYYRPKKNLYNGDTEVIETITRAQITYDEDPIGILYKPCPVCGYKYGTEWIKEKVPQDVIDWLFNLPESTVKPAWI